MSNELVRIDRHPLNGLEFRIDAFSGPTGSRNRFDALMGRNVAFIETLPGFVGIVALGVVLFPLCRRRRARPILEITTNEMTRIKEANVRPVIVINRLAIKPGAINEFIEAQLNYASTLMEKPTGLIGSRLYRGLDGRTVVLVSQFESIKAQEDIFKLPSFKANLSKLQTFVESSSPAIYEEAHTTDGFK